MRIGVLGSGVVGQTLAAGFVKHGHPVMVGTRDVLKLKDWAGKNPHSSGTELIGLEPIVARHSALRKAGRYRRFK